LKATSGKKRKNSHAVQLGRLGGRSKSPAKVAAGRRNVVKALQARLKKALDKNTSGSVE